MIFIPPIVYHGLAAIVMLAHVVFIGFLVLLTTALTEPAGMKAPAFAVVRDLLGYRHDRDNAGSAGTSTGDIDVMWGDSMASA